MSLPQTYTVPDTIRRERADKVLAAAFPELSRVAWQRSFDAGLVRRAGVVLDKKHDLHAGEVIEFAHADVVPSELHASGTKLDILFEDVHPGAGTKDNTLVHALLGHCAGTLSGIGGVERPGIVHRLDRDTTGVMLVAKSDAAHRALSEQFAGRNLHKEYLALVSGVPRLLSGTLDGAIARNKIHRHRMAVTEDGKPARTDWKREEAFLPLAALMRCHILTGRTHQIRIHMKTAGHPLLGDVTYGWKDYGKLPIKPERVMLHSEMIRFTHPISGKQMEVRAPLPPDFKAMIAALRIAAEAIANPGKRG
jgi:23S rRNA pseudouridine1911/1915/1917 synthase